MGVALEADRGLALAADSALALSTLVDDVRSARASALSLIAASRFREAAGVLETIHALGVRLLGSLPPARQALAQQERFGRDKGPTSSHAHPSLTSASASGAGAPDQPAWKQELADASYVLLIGKC